MKLENPFNGMAYITEKGVQPEKVLESYSILPLKHLISHLTKQINSFFVGRTGVGKTMVLSLFDPAYQLALYTDTTNSKSLKEREKILELIPKEVIGIYSNIDSPYFHLTQFQGKVQNEENWMKIFGDYYGHILVRDLILALEKLSLNEKWREHNNVSEFNIEILDLVAIDYSKKICDELPDIDGISSWNSLKKYINNRISSWISAVSKLGADTFSGPSEIVQLINPCLYLMEQLKEKEIIGSDCRLFIIIDQYETLFEHRKNIDFRPIFNLAMRQAARGETRIEFKMGVRPYGYKDSLNILGSNIKLDLVKECQEIFIDELTSDYYDEFIKDLTQKCLKKYREYDDYSDRPHTIFEKLTAVQEVKKYVGSSTKRDKHFSLFFNECNQSENISKEEIKDFIKETVNGYDSECKVWIETLLSIHAEKVLDKNKDVEFLKSQLYEHFTNLKAVLFTTECKMPKECKCINNIDENQRIREYNSYKDIRPGALFIIAASYKNKPKIYSGYDTLVNASSRIVLHYIEIVSEAFDNFLLEDRTEFKPLPADNQSEAIYKRANRFFDNIPNTLPHGMAVNQILKKLGILFREEQLNPKLTKPYPNVFSVVKDLINQFEPESISDSYEREIITELLSYGFLEEEKHHDKNRKKGTRYKYYLNRLLCPYFGVSIVHRKDPLYIYGDEKEFLRCLIDNNCKIDELRKYLNSKTTTKVRVDKDLAQFSVD